MSSALAPLVYTDVHKHFGDYHALRGVSLEVRSGEVFGLLGPNGAGKTTLIRIGMDILRAEAGEVRLFGEPKSRRNLDRVSYLPEERGLYPKTPVIDMLVYLGRLKGMTRRDAKDAANRWLQRIGLASHAKQNVAALSKGMGQKVQIAAALMNEPALCVLDEPFSGLDPVNVDLVKELIQERRKAGRTTILSTHMMNQVEALCDRVGIIHQGQLVVYGDLETVRREHAHARVKVRLDGPHEAHRLEGEGITKVEHRPDHELLTLSPEANPAAVLRSLIEGGAPIAHFETELATMEQIFLDAVRRREAA